MSARKQNTVQVPYLTLTGAQPEKPYRPETARDLYWQAFQALAGQPWATVRQELESNPPKVPKSGKVEKASGWLSYFQRQGLAKLTHKAVKAPAA